MRPFFVYMLRCRDGHYYVGHTDDLERRMNEHDAGVPRGYTSTRRPVKLVWSHECYSRELALEIELQVKPWSRRKKGALARGDFPALKLAARGKNRHERAGPSTSRPATGTSGSGTGATLGTNGGVARTGTNGGMGTLGTSGCGDDWRANAFPLAPTIPAELHPPFAPSVGPQARSRGARPATGTSGHETGATLGTNGRVGANGRVAKPGTNGGAARTGTNGGKGTLGTSGCGDDWRANALPLAPTISAELHPPFAPSVGPQARSRGARPLPGTTELEPGATPGTNGGKDPGDA